MPPVSAKTLLGMFKPAEYLQVLAEQQSPQNVFTAAANTLKHLTKNE